MREKWGASVVVDRVGKTTCHLATLLVTALLLTLALHQARAEFPDKKEVSGSPSATWCPTGDVTTITNGAALVATLSAGAPSAEQELGLMELVDLGLEHNPTTRSAWQNARSAAAQARAARSTYAPTLTLKGSGGPSHATTPAYPGFSKVDQMSGGPALSITWLLLDFGASAAGAEAARQALFSSNFQFNQAFQDVIYGIMNSYYTLDSMGALQEASLVSLKLADSTVEAVARKMKSGLVSRTNWLQAIQNQAQARYNLESAKGNFISARAALLQSVGLPANAGLRILPPPITPDLGPLDREADQLIAEALNQRPDVSAKVADFLSKKAKARQDAANIWPTLTASAGLQRTFYDADATMDPRTFSGSSHDNQYGATLTFSMDLFDGMYKVNQARASRSAAEAAEADLTRAQLAAIADVVTNYNGVQTAVRKVAASQALLDASQKSFEAMRIGYKNGLNSILDLLNAQDGLASARTQHIQARNELFIAAAQLIRATGGLSREAIAHQTNTTAAAAIATIQESEVRSQHSE